ncbi:MAG: hypothetical protein AAFQ91_34445, partial [Cyanobacteria bacterium J06621_15]
TFAKGQGELVLTSLRHPKEDKSDVDFILNTLGQLWLHGLKINWNGFYQSQYQNKYQDRKLYRIPLPTYPFERKRYWIDASTEISQEITSNNKNNNQNKNKINLDGDWFYIPKWERNRTNYISPEKFAESKYVWLIFIDDAGIGAEIAQHLGTAFISKIF